MESFKAGDRIAYRRRHVLSAWYIGTIEFIAAGWATVIPDGPTSNPEGRHAVELTDPDRTEVKLTHCPAPVSK